MLNKIFGSKSDSNGGELQPLQGQEVSEVVVRCPEEEITKDSSLKIIENSRPVSVHSSKTLLGD